MRMKNTFPKQQKEIVETNEEVVSTKHAPNNGCLLMMGLLVTKRAQAQGFYRVPVRFLPYPPIRH